MIKKNKINDLLVNPNEPLLNVLRKIDNAGKGTAIVVDENNKLLGIITDGDIRRFILSQGSLSSNIATIYNKEPKYAFEDLPSSQYKSFLLQHEIDVFPLLDPMMCVVNVLFLDDLLGEQNEIPTINMNKTLQETTVVIMAGGNGTRLYPYTKILPKPLIPIGDKPISERIIENFLKFGCSQFYFSVNYKANMIKAYYADIEKNYNIDYIQEDQPLGTAGSLYLLKNKIKDTFFVVNCDIIIDTNYQKLYEFHKKMGHKITMVGAIKDYQIPYGIIEVSQSSNKVDKIIEKPQYHFIVNTGMYVLEPEVLNRIPENSFYHITHLIEDLLKEEEKIGVYPVHGDSWLDMGQFEEMKEMMNKLGVV